MKPTKFHIKCPVCDREICDMEETKEGNIVIYCKSCGNAEVLGK